MSPRPSRKGVVYAALLGILVGSSVMGWSAVHAIRQDVRTMEVPFGATGDVFWLFNDYYRLREDLLALAAGRADLAPSDVVERIEILWSRGELLREAPALAALRDQLAAERLAEGLQALLDRLGQDVRQLRTGDTERALVLVGELDRFREPLQTLSLGLERLLDQRAVEVRQGIGDVLDRLDWVGFAGIAVTVTLLALFAGEAWAAKRAQRAKGEREAELQFLAYHDPLTRLPNRRNMIQYLGATLTRLERAGGTAALLVVDLDGFKPVNDNFGHEAGDRLLAEIAQRLTLELRAGDFVARLGGDEFVLVTVTPPGEDGVIQLAERLIYVIEQPVDVGGQQAKVSASIGVARYPTDASTPTELYRHADIALYAAKAAGRSRTCHFERRMIEAEERRRAVEERLRHAIAEGAIELYCQPQVTLADGRVDGVEALLRWQDERLGRVSPAEFVPIAESIGFIAEIDRWVLTRAIRTAAAWTGPASRLRIAVNLSARQFAEQDLATRVERELSAYGLAADRLELEITEGALLDHTAATEAQLRHLRTLGVRIAVDDFGVGYSSLSYLKRLPIDQLKIDRSFIRDIESDPQDRAIVEGILGLAAALRLEVVAEGIETEAQRRFLLSRGCMRGQGYLFARPMPTDELEAHLAELVATPLLERPEPAALAPEPADA